MNIKKEKELDILEKKFYNKRLDLSQQQKTEKNMTENNKITSRGNVRDTYSAFQNNFETTTEPSNININNNNGNLNQDENNSENKNSNNEDINEENNKLNGIEDELNKESKEKNE